ncbi:MAG: T9SS type A sorting domain-containing protein [Pigmentiphaga sp.]|nr:T9SS type A sorting domain-containing protein [Pigmentiphaga sp.]
MAKKLLLMITAIAIFTTSYADDDLWIDINFTRDSTMWLEALPDISLTGGPWEGIGFNSQVSLSGEYEVNGATYGIVGAFGRFAVNNYSYTPLNAENLEEQFIYAYRLANNENTYFALPGTSDVGSVKIHYLCGNKTDVGLIKLQKFAGVEEVQGEEGEEPTFRELWEDFSPAITFDVPPHDGSLTSFYSENKVNLTEVSKLRLKGPALRNVHIFSIQVSKYVETGLQSNIFDNVQFNLTKRNLTISNINNFNAEVYNLAGIKLGNFKDNETYSFNNSGVYLIQLKTDLGNTTKKIIVE